MATMEVAIWRPRFWWRGPSSDLRRWVAADPDVQDRRQRWRDRDEQRWKVIAEGVGAVSQGLAGEEWSTDPEDASAGWGWLSIDLSTMPTETEHRILRSWFSAGEAVSGDPWFHPITNGRHRLWSTMPFLAEHLIPILGDSLSYANAEDAAEIGPKWPSVFAGNVAELDVEKWFRTTDPVNSRFVSALQTAAAGRFPRAS